MKKNSFCVEQFTNLVNHNKNFGHPFGSLLARIVNQIKSLVSTKHNNIRELSECIGLSHADLIYISTICDKNNAISLKSFLLTYGFNYTRCLEYLYNNLIFVKQNPKSELINSLAIVLGLNFSEVETLCDIVSPSPKPEPVATPHIVELAAALGLSTTEVDLMAKRIINMYINFLNNKEK